MLSEKLIDLVSMNYKSISVEVNVKGVVEVKSYGTVCHTEGCNFTGIQLWLRLQELAAFFPGTEFHFKYKGLPRATITSPKGLVELLHLMSRPDKVFQFGDSLVLGFVEESNMEMMRVFYNHAELAPGCSLDTALRRCVIDAVTLVKGREPKTRKQTLGALASSRDSYFGITTGRIFSDKSIVDTIPGLVCVGSFGSDGWDTKAIKKTLAEWLVRA